MTNWNQFNPLPGGSLPIDMREFRQHNVRFTPSGKVHCCGNPETLDKFRNPTERLGATPLTARLFVGLNVGRKPTYKIDDVVRITRAVRTRQGAPPDSSFLVQKGLYTEPGGDVIKENSVQIVIFDFGKKTKKQEAIFEKQMEELAQVLVKKLHQKEIYVEMQRSGIPYTVLRVYR